MTRRFTCRLLAGLAGTLKHEPGWRATVAGYSLGMIAERITP